MESLIEVYAGSYSPETEEGIHLLQFAPTDGKLKRLDGVSGITNPSFLTLNLKIGCFYAVSETNGGSVASYHREADGSSFKETSRQPSEGDSPCHVTLDSSGDWLLLVNYSSGSVCVYPINQNGTIGPRSEQMKFSGNSVHPSRQESSHPHFVTEVPGTSFYLMADLGTDTVHTIRLDRTNGKLYQHAKASVRPGDGPRHIAMHPSGQFVYVIEELSCVITSFVLNAQSGSLQPIGRNSTLPENFEGENTCAEILVSESGKYLYTSNRGHDSIVTFRIHDGGTLERIAHTPSGGHTPRNFAIIPGDAYLLSANQDSDNIVVFQINENGVPERTGHILQVHQPVCLKAAVRTG